MVTKALRLSVILGAVATGPMLAQQTAPQLVTVRHASGQSVSPVYEGFDINPDGTCNMWFVYLDAADFPRLLDERKAKPTSTSSGQNR